MEKQKIAGQAQPQRGLKGRKELQERRETRNTDAALPNSVEGQRMNTSRCESVAVAEANMRYTATKDCLDERPDGRNTKVLGGLDCSVSSCIG